jgi:inorganic triphosphatase YgiF
MVAMVEASQSAAHELELKFEFDRADAGLIEAQPALAASSAPPSERRLISVYFDTDDFALRKAGVTLRVRDTGDRYVQTIKTANGAELFDRLEWECEIAGRKPDLEAARKTALEPLQDRQIRDALRPIFETRIDRRVYRLGRNGTEIEVALDWGEVATATRYRPVCELELELKRGEPAELFSLARELSASVPLRLGVKTKAERGYALIGEDHDGAERAAPIQLDADMACAEAFRAIAGSCLRQVVANEPAMCAGDAEALHQMRIGLRRLRAAIKAFADMAVGPEQERIKAELRWVTGALGPARDLDVFAAEVLEPLGKTKGEEAGFAEAYRAFMVRRAEAHRSAAGSVRSDRFRGILLDVAEWIEVGPWTVDPELTRARERQAKEHAAVLLARLRKQIRRQDQPVKEFKPRQRHKLRIRAKALRYTIEFFASLFPGEKNQSRRKEALAALKELQDGLGALNDLATREALAARSHDLSDHAARLLRSGGDRVDRLLKRAQAAHDRFAKVKSFWK